MRAEGHAVTVASLEHDGEGAGEADLHFRLKRTSDLLALARLVPAFDRCVLHYQHDFFFDGLQARQLVTHNLLLGALFARGVEVVCHEIVYPLLAGDCGALVAASERFKWRCARLLWVHTAFEATTLQRLLPGAPVRRRDHHADFTKFRDVDQATARRDLSLPPSAKIFLCIGFLQPHKGFDRAMRAFSALPDAAARLFVVGAARVPKPETLAHIQELKALAQTDSRIALVEGFLSDAQFDTWLSAADVVVVPYREICSSSVVARARLFGKRVVAAAVGGLATQLAAGDVLVQPGESWTHALQRALDPPAPQAIANAPLRLAVVAPWYGADVPGGGERVVREFAQRLAASGAEVEVFTTQIASYFSDWSKNARPAEARVAGVAVHRFPVEPRDAMGFGPIAARASAGEPLSAAERAVFFGEMIRAPGLAAALAANRERFDLFLLGHYMFATTVSAALAVGDKGVLLPFLHDEPYARLPAYREAFAGLRGALLLSGPEAPLAQRLFGLPPERCAVVGAGLDPPGRFSRFTFARRHGLGRYFLYLGRKEDGKNVPLLLSHFRAYWRTHPKATLVLIGPGAFEPLPGDAGSIVDLGVVCEREKRDALAGALALLQPSVLESFSLSIMESWQVARPVLVHADCPVTRDHVERSGGGLIFSDAATFAAALDRFAERPAEAKSFGRAGKAYVKREFGWSEVTQRLLSALEDLRGAGPRQS